MEVWRKREASCGTRWWKMHRKALDNRALTVDDNVAGIAASWTLFYFYLSSWFPDIASRAYSSLFRQSEFVWVRVFCVCVCVCLCVEYAVRCDYMVRLFLSRHLSTWKLYAFSRARRISQRACFDGLWYILHVCTMYMIVCVVLCTRCSVLMSILQGWDVPYRFFLFFYCVITKLNKTPNNYTPTYTFVGQIR